MITSTMTALVFVMCSSKDICEEYHVDSWISDSQDIISLELDMAECESKSINADPSYTYNGKYLLASGCETYTIK